MRMTRSQLAVALAIGLICKVQEVSAQCLSPKVLFVNGVWNSRIDAQGGQVALKNALVEGGAPADLSVGMVYNPTDGKFEDLLEVAQDYQLTEANLSFSAALLTPGFVLANFGLSSERFRNLPGLAGFAARYAWAAEYIDKEISSNEPSSRNLQVEARIRERVESEIRTAKRPVILVAHSQGNFYVNRVVGQLKRSLTNTEGLQAIGVVGIGVASKTNLGTDFQPDLYRYITRSDDLVITPISGSLRANYLSAPSPSNSGSSPSRHLLIEDYLTSNRIGSYFSSPDLVSPRSIVQRHFNDVHAAVAKAWPCVTADYEPRPVGQNGQATLKAFVNDRLGNPLSNGRVTFETSNGDILATQKVSNGVASISHTFDQIPTGTKLIARWVDDSPIPVPDRAFKASSPPVEISASVPQQHWAAKYAVIPGGSCTPLPSNARIWFWQDPCYAYVGSSGASGTSYTAGAFYFDNISADVIFEAFRGTDRNNDIRTVKALNWRSSQDTFVHEIPSQFLLNRSPAVPGTISESSSIRYNFAVTFRSASLLAGTFTISMRSGYFDQDNVSLAWHPVDTQARGTWSAELVNKPKPDTQMKSSDYCFRFNNSGIRSTVIPNPDTNPDVLPGWAGGFTANGCVYGQ